MHFWTDTCTYKYFEMSFQQLSEQNYLNVSSCHASNSTISIMVISLKTENNYMEGSWSATVQ